MKWRTEDCIHGSWLRKESVQNQQLSYRQKRGSERELENLERRWQKRKNKRPRETKVSKESQILKKISIEMLRLKTTQNQKHHGKHQQYIC